MPRQQYAEPPTAVAPPVEPTREPAARPAGPPRPVAVPAGPQLPMAARPLPDWHVALRHGARIVVEQALGDDLAPTLAEGLLILAIIAGLLAVIAITLSVGNAVLVLVVGVVMRSSRS